MAGGAAASAFKAFNVGALIIRIGFGVYNYVLL